MSEQKKGMPVWGWIGLGCAGLVLIGVMAIFAGGLFVAKKVGDVVENIEANPARAAAEVLVRADPDLEIKGSDDEAGTVTIYNKETDEELTVDLDALKDGRLEWSTGGGQSGSITVDGEQGLRVESSEGNMTIGKGADAAPTWVPTPSGVEIQSTFSTNSAQGLAGAFGFATDDTIDDTVDFYKQTLGSQGYTFEVDSRNRSPQGEQAILSAVDEDDQRRINVVVVSDSDNQVQVQVQYNQGVE